VRAGLPLSPDRKVAARRGTASPSTLNSMPPAEKFCARRLFVSNAKGIVVIAPKLCQEGNIGRLSKIVFADVIV
jgi:hypothetical protein